MSYIMPHMEILTILEVLCYKPLMARIRLWVPKVTNFGNFWQHEVTKIGNLSVTFEQPQNGV